MISESGPSTCEVAGGVPDGAAELHINQYAQPIVISNSFLFDSTSPEPGRRLAPEITLLEGIIGD